MTSLRKVRVRLWRPRGLGLRDFGGLGFRGLGVYGIGISGFRVWCVGGLGLFLLVYWGFQTPLVKLRMLNGSYGS